MPSQSSQPVGCGRDCLLGDGVDPMGGLDVAGVDPAPTARAAVAGGAPWTSGESSPVATQTPNSRPMSLLTSPAHRAPFASTQTRVAREAALPMVYLVVASDDRGFSRPGPGPAVRGSGLRPRVTPPVLCQRLISGLGHGYPVVRGRGDRPAHRIRPVCHFGTRAGRRMPGMCKPHIHFLRRFSRIGCSPLALTPPLSLCVFRINFPSLSTGHAREVRRSAVPVTSPRHEPPG